MSYPIGRKAHTRGQMAVWLPCVRCGVRTRVYRRPADQACRDDRGVTCCAPCHNGRESSAEVSALIDQLAREVVRPQLDAYRAAEQPYTGPYVPGRLTEVNATRERHRLAVWEQAVADSLAERGVPNGCTPLAAAV